MNFIDIDGTTIAYTVRGTGNKTIVIDTAIGTCSAEWWHIAEKLSERYKVVTFDRAGYGESGMFTKKRTPQNIADELNNLLVYLNISKNIILLGHSQGGFYSLQYALMYSAKVIGMVLLDPATPYDSEFIQRLTVDEYRKSGVDKTSGMKLGLWLTSLKLGFIAKPMLKKMPPFYYHTFAKDAEGYLLQSLCKKSTYATALEEYKFTHIENAIADVKKAIEHKGFGNLPIKLITHSSVVYSKELQEFGSMDLQTASKIEDIWQNSMKKILNLSTDTEHIVAAKSGHYIHLTDLDTVLETIGTLS